MTQDINEYDWGDLVAPPLPAPTVTAIVPATPEVPAPVTDLSSFEIACPTCGTLGIADPSQRDSAAFCRVCDYPLFWARERVLTPTSGDDAEDSLRRLPGTGGRTVIANITCPVCTELNAATALICRRCGSDLHPKPAALPAPEPAPVIVAAPAPEPKRNWWPWIIGGAIVVALLTALVFILVHYEGWPW